MTIENELLSIQNLQQEYADFENNPETKFMSPELVDEIKKEFENRLQIYQQRIRRKQNISDTVNFANESSEEAYKAKRQQERAEMNPVERGLNAVADYSAKTIPLAGELASNIALGGGGFLARSAGNLTGWKGLETIGEKTMQANRDFKNWLDIENSFPSYFEGTTDHEWNSVGGATQNVIGGVGKFMEGYHEFAPLGLATSGVGAGIGMAGKALGAGEKAVKAAQATANLGLFASSNVANTSDYIEQTSGKFKPIQSGVSSAASALAMEIAFALGRGRGMNDVEASNYATRMLTENQFAMMGKKAFKQSFTTAIANGLLNGGVGTWIREEFALPDNATQEDYDRLASNVWEAIKHETAQGAIWGGFGAIQYHNEVRKLFNQLGGKETITTPDGKKRSVYKTNASAKFILENSEKLQKEKFPNLFEKGNLEEVNTYLDELFKSVPEKLILGKSAEFGEQKENFKAALLREYNLGHLKFDPNSRFTPKIRNAKENKEAQTVNSLMANKVKGLYSQYVAAKTAIKNIDIEIEASKEDLQKQQELARQKEELQLKSYALTTQLEKPYSVYDMVGFIRQALEKQYGQMPEFMKRVDDVLSRYMSDNWQTPISADEAMGVYNQIAGELSKLDTRNVYDDYNSKINNIVNFGQPTVYGNDERGALPESRQLGWDGAEPPILPDTTGYGIMPSSVMAEPPVLPTDGIRGVSSKSPTQASNLPIRESANNVNGYEGNRVEPNKPTINTERGQMNLKANMPRENMNISQPRENLPINDKISGKSTSESPSSFKESTSSLNIPKAVKSAKPVEQPSETGNIKPIKQNKIDSTNKIGNKAVRDSESFDTRADMPQSVMTDRSESPAIKNERGKMGLDVEMKQKELPKTETKAKAEFDKKVVTGNKTKMTTKANGGMEVDGQFGVVDVNDLQTATSIGETQNRNRETISSQAQINSIGNNPNPEYLIVNNPDSANGAMVITADGKVLSGNGRTLGLKMAYESGNAEKYKAYLREHAKEFGIDPKEIDKIDNPVLVRIIDPKDGFDVKRFVKESNESQQLGRNAAEIARTDAENIKDILRFFNGTKELNSESNSEFIRKFFEKTVGDTERANYLANDGSLTPDGERRITNALIASLYGNNPRLIERLSNTTNEGVKKIANALIQSANDSSKLRGEIQQGKFWNIDLGKDISDAALAYMDTVGEMNRQKAKGSVLSFYLKNMKDRLSPDGKVILGMFSELKSAQRIKDFINIMNGVVRGKGDPNQGLLFGESGKKPTNGEIIREALQEFDSQFGTDFSKKDLRKWNMADKTLFDLDDPSVKENRTKFIPDYKSKKLSEFTEKDWEEYNKEQNRIADDILGKENTDKQPVVNSDNIKLSKQKQAKNKVLKEFLPDIFEKYDEESIPPAPVQELQNILRQGEALADIDYALNSGDPREAIEIIRDIRQKVEFAYPKEFADKIAKNCNRLIKMIKNSNYRDKAIKPISIEELEAQPINKQLSLSRTKNKATNTVTDKDLNNFLKGQAKQITKETGLNFKVVNSVDELRKMFPNNDITDTVEGGIHKDTVYLVKGNIDKDRLPLVIAHEVAGHRGVESLFENKQQMDNFFNSLERASAKDKFIRDAFAEVDRLGYKENRSREAMAKIVEKVRNESGTLKGTAKTFVNFITSRVRRFLRKLGFKNLQLNEAEVYDLAVQALRRTGLKNSNKFFGLDRFLAKDNSFLSATSTELDQKYPGWSNRQTTSTGRHSTQAAITEKTYKKIGDWILNSNLKNSKILDASSGMGLGTEALRKMGLNVDDIEPYPGDRKIKPTYSGEDYLDYTEVYKKHGKTYDLIISNAVLNVIPYDWRKAQLHAMADVLLNKGGKLIINVRGDKEVANTKNKIILDSPNEILLPNGNGGYRAYQKGFSQKEFQDWVSKELGAGYKVEKLTPKNSGLSSSTTGVIVTKEGGNDKNNTVPKADIQFSIGARKSPIEDVGGKRKVKPNLTDELAQKIIDEVGEVRNPKDYNAVKKIAKENMAEYKDLFSTKKNTGYKTAALKLHYLTGYKMKNREVEKNFKAIKDFNVLKKTAGAYIRNIIDDKSAQANLLDKVVKANSFEKVYDIITNTNIAKEKELRQNTLNDFIENMKNLKAKKVSSATYEAVQDIIDKNFTEKELDGLLNTNEFTTEAVSKLRDLADGIASGLGSISKTDVEVAQWAIDNARKLKKGLNNLIQKREEGSTALNVPVEKLAEVNTLLNRLYQQEKEARKALDTSLENAAVADKQKILAESPEAKNPDSRDTYSIGTVKENLAPVTAVNSLDNDNITAKMGKTMHKVAYENLLEGQNRQDHYRAEGYKVVDDIYQSFGKNGDLRDGMNNLNETAMQVETSKGHKYDITKGEVLAAVATYMDSETRQIIDRAGGVDFFLGAKRDSDYFTLTTEKLKEMTDSLTPLEKKALKKGSKLLSQVFLPAINETHERLNGVPLRIREDGIYFPRFHVNLDESIGNGIINRDSAPYLHQQMNADYQAMLKQRNSKARPSLMLKSFPEVLNSYVDQGALYIGMAEPLRHLNRVMTEGMKRELISRYGKEYVDRITTLTKNMAGMAGKTDADRGLSNRFLSNIAAAKLTPVSAVKQFSSVPLASSIIDFKYLAKAALSGLSNENINEMMKLDSMILRYRNNGIAGIIPLNTKTWEGERQLQKHSNKWYNKIVDTGLNLSVEADKRALGIIYKATKLMAEAKGKSNDKAWIEKTFMDAVRRTQNTTDLASANGWQMKSRESAYWSFLNMYQNQTQKIGNEAVRLFRGMKEAEKQYGKESAQYKEAKGKAVDFAIGVAIMNAMSIGIGAGASAILHKKDEKETARQKAADFATDTIFNLTGNPILKPVMGGSSYVLRKSLPEALGGSAQRTQSEMFGNDFTNLVPDTIYTAGKIFEEINSDDPVAKKFRKVTSEALRSKSFENGLAMGRVPTWFLRYPSQLYRKYAVDESKSSKNISTGSTSLFKKRPQKKTRWKF